MYNILYVDNDQGQHVLLEELLKSAGNFLTPISALNCQDAIHIMDEVKVSLLLADFPILGDHDGWDLIKHLKKKNGGIKSLIITDSNDIEEVRQLKSTVDHILFKPINDQEIVQIVTTFAQHGDITENWCGIPIISSLQQIEKEKKTCLLEVKTSENVRGLIYFKEGVLYDSMYRAMRGEEAVLALIGSNSTQLRLLKAPTTTISRRIKSELLTIIIKAVQLKSAASCNHHDIENSSNHTIKDQLDYSPVLSEKIVPQQSEPEERVIASDNNSQVAGEPCSHTQQKETNIMALENNIETLRGINGYKAAALMNFTGEILAADSVDEQVDLANVGAVFNDIFRAAHEAAGSVGLSVCNELTIKTPNGLIIMTCSGVDAPIHFHLIAVLNKDGNQALAKMKLDKLIPIILEELTK